MSSGPWILVEDLSSVYNDVELDKGTVKHVQKKRKLAEGREKAMVITDFIYLFICLYIASVQGADQKSLIDYCIFVLHLFPL